MVLSEAANLLSEGSNPSASLICTLYKYKPKHMYTPQFSVIDCVYVYLFMTTSFYPMYIILLLLTKLNK